MRKFLRMDWYSTLQTLYSLEAAYSITDWGKSLATLMTSYLWIFYSLHILLGSIQVWFLVFPVSFRKFHPDKKKEFKTCGRNLITENWGSVSSMRVNLSKIENSFKNMYDWPLSFAVHMTNEDCVSFIILQLYNSLFLASNLGCRLCSSAHS